MKVRERQKERTRARILRAAVRLFARRGITASRTIDVARSARVSHGTVFVHFPTREDLVASVIGEFGSRVAARIHDLVDGEGGLREGLQAHLAGLQSEEGFYRRLVAEGPVLPLCARSVLVGIQSAVSFHLEEVWQREVDAGRCLPIRFHLLFNTWIGLIHHYISNRDLFAPGESVLARYGPELIDHFLTLVKM